MGGSVAWRLVFLKVAGLSGLPLGFTWILVRGPFPLIPATGQQPALPRAGSYLIKPARWCIAAQELRQSSRARYEPVKQARQEPSRLAGLDGGGVDPGATSGRGGGYTCTYFVRGCDAAVSLVGCNQQPCTWPLAGRAADKRMFFPVDRSEVAAAEAQTATLYGDAIL